MGSTADVVAVGARYRTFWRRFGAALLDGIVLLPVEILVVWSEQMVSSTLWFVPLYGFHAVYVVAYSISLHARFGQTVGKMATHVKVLDVSGAAIGLRQAVLRDCPMLLLSIVDAVWVAFEWLRADSADRTVASFTGPFVIGLAATCWMLLELATMLTNPKRRAIHDFLGRTVVIRTGTQEGRLPEQSQCTAQ